MLLELDNDGRELRVTVSDDGIGLPDGFTADAATGLGVSIVRTLVTTELGGTIAFGPGLEGGPGPGTAVDLRVPLAPEAETLDL